MSSFAKQDWDRWFPETRDPPPPGTFEIGLVLAGAISGGAYSAGVIDYLVEALDKWQAAKADADVPQHNVVLRVVTGASAGGMVGAIASVALKYRFPHVSPATPYDPNTPSPLYRAWVKEIDITKLLDTADLGEGRVPSLLDSSVLQTIADTAVGYQGAAPPPRPWLPETLPVLLTVTNLRGVPYRLHHRSATGFGHDMLMHQDHMAFLLQGLGSTKAYSMPAPPGTGGYVVLDGRNDVTKTKWKGFSQAALATGAFPLALAPRALERPATDYDCRFPGCAVTVGATVTTLVPEWPTPGAATPYRFLTVDGGTMDNEPFELARVALAGTMGRNPREGDKANRAVLMVDPFCEPNDFGPEDDSRPLTDVAKALIGALKNQSRFKPSELELALRDDVYSRFLIAPSRSGVRGARAIASGGLNAFLGFFAEAYRHHDYMLGRKNCRDFLRWHFTLPMANPLFDGRWTAEARRRFASPDEPTQLQIIPVLDDNDAAWEAPPAWPTGAMTSAKRDQLDTLIAGRLDVIYGKIKAGLRADAKVTDGSWWDRVKARAGVEAGIGWFAVAWNAGLRRKILTTVKTQIADAVDGVDHATYPPQQPPATPAVPPAPVIVTGGHFTTEGANK